MLDIVIAASSISSCTQQTTFSALSHFFFVSLYASSKWSKYRRNGISGPKKVLPGTLYRGDFLRNQPRLPRKSSLSSRPDVRTTFHTCSQVIFFKVRMSFPELNLVSSFHLRWVSKSSLKETQRSTNSVSGRQNPMHFLGIACIVVNNASIWKGSNSKSKFL